MDTKMTTTVKELKDYLKDIPDDYEVWIEYPKRYGTAKPTEIIKGFDDQDFIKSMSLGKNESKVFIFHHF